MSWFDTLLQPIMVVVAWIMVGVHDLLVNMGMGSTSGATWTLSIVALVIIMRALLIPLFVKQIRSARAMQMLSPELQALQKKYKGRNDPASREAMTRETMELYQKHGTNPFSSCLPILAQSPIFFALFRVLNNLPRIASGDFPTVGPMDQDTASSIESAEIFGAPISAWFFQEGASTQVKIVTVALIVAMSLTTFTTQKQLTQKNMPASAMQGPMAQQQKMLLYVLPLIFAISGVNFPIGVLIYWTTTNLWSMGQQFYVIRRNPTPGSEAERRLKERRAKKAARRGIVLEEEPTEPEKPRGQRQQPVRKERAKGSGSPAARTGRPASPGGKPAAAGKPARAAGAGSPSAKATDGTGKTSTARAAAAGSKASGAGKAKPVGGKPGGTKSPAAGAKEPGSTGAKTPGSGGAEGKPAGKRPTGAKATGSGQADDAGQAAQAVGSEKPSRSTTGTSNPRSKARPTRSSGDKATGAAAEDAQTSDAPVSDQDEK